jgi:hypothetical protein
METVEQRAPNGFTDLDTVISRQELEEISASDERTAGFDPSALNDRPSLSVSTGGGGSAAPAGPLSPPDPT